jgi:hypothetical protein
MAITVDRPHNLLKSLIKVIAVIAVIAVIGIAIYSLGLRLEAAGYIPYIQKAIDEQCNNLDIVVGVTGYLGDPMPSWSSPEVFCQKDFDGSWICDCARAR